MRLNLSCILLALAASLPAAANELPDAIAVPGEIQVATVNAVGAQIYECKPDASGGLGWQFREPIATLFKNGKTVGRHYAGPDWEMADGSAVVAKVSGRAPSANENAIPLLRLAVTSQRGAGQLAGVTTIQRLNTEGGVADGPCDTVDDVLNVPYTADYVFYRKAGASAPVAHRPATAIAPAPVAAPYAAAVSLIVLPHDIPGRPWKKRRKDGQPKSPPTAEPKAPTPGEPKTPPTAEPKSPPSKGTPTKVVRNHRGSSGGGTKVTPTRPRYDGAASSEKRKPEIRDHRGVDPASREAASDKRKPDIRDHRGTDRGEAPVRSTTKVRDHRGADRGQAPARSTTKARDHRGSVTASGGGSSGSGGCGKPSTPACQAQ